MLNYRDEVLPGDCEAVRRIVAATGMFRPNEIEVAVELVTERLARGVASGYHFVFAEQDQEVLGYVCFGPITVTLHSYDLYWIAVDPAQQRKGLGKSLMLEAESRIQQLGGSQVFLETSGLEIYAPTRSFYERCGYKVVANIPDFYAPGDSKLIYVCRLGMTFLKKSGQPNLLK